MELSTSSIARPGDGIDDILGRFQAWANSCKQPSKTEEMIDGVREPSYEEALQSSRDRWRTRAGATATSANKRNRQRIPR